MSISCIREDLPLCLVRDFTHLHLRYDLAQRPHAKCCRGRCCDSESRLSFKYLVLRSIDACSFCLDEVKKTLEALGSLKRLHARHHGYVVEILHVLNEAGTQSLVLVVNIRHGLLVLRASVSHRQAIWRGFPVRSHLNR